MIALVHEDDNPGHANLASKQDVLTRLRHGAVRSGHDKNGAVHLGSTGDHVLHIVSVTRAIHVCIVPVVRLILHVTGCDGDATRIFGGIMGRVALRDSPRRLGDLVVSSVVLP